MQPVLHPNPGPYRHRPYHGPYLGVCDRLGMITTSCIKAMLDMADAGGLPFVTYAEMQPGPRRTAVAVASGASRFVKST
jgi:hypothetical protein